MRCEDAAAQIADYLDGTLSAEATGALERHAAECPRCRAELDGFEDTWRLLADVPPERTDSAAMRRRFTRMLDAHVLAEAASVAPMRQGWRWGPVAALSGAAAALVVGVAIGRTTAPPPDPAVTELRQELRDMRVMVGLALMQQPSASERLRGVSWSSRIDQPGNDVVEALLDTLMHDSNDNVRLATVDALRRFADREIVRTAAVEALSRQTSPLVQAALIDFVVDADDRAAVDTLHRLSNDETVHDSVRERAARAAKQLS